MERRQDAAIVDSAAAPLGDSSNLVGVQAGMPGRAHLLPQDRPCKTEQYRQDSTPAL